MVAKIENKFGTKYDCQATVNIQKNLAISFFGQLAEDAQNIKEIFRDKKNIYFL